MWSLTSPLIKNGNVKCLRQGNTLISVSSFRALVSDGLEGNTNVAALPGGYFQYIIEFPSLFLRFWYMRYNISNI